MAFELIPFNSIPIERRALHFRWRVTWQRIKRHLAIQSITFAFIHRILVFFFVSSTMSKTKSKIEKQWSILIYRGLFDQRGLLVATLTLAMQLSQPCQEKAKRKSTTKFFKSFIHSFCFTSASAPERGSKVRYFIFLKFQKNNGNSWIKIPISQIHYRQHK